MRIKVNNVELYYEKHGKGKPIILLHGNQETHDIFDKLIEKLKSPDYRTIHEFLKNPLLVSLLFIIIIKHFHILHFRFVNILGRESLIVFCTHLMFLTPLLSCFSIKISQFNVLESCLFIIIALMITIVFCLTCISIFNKKYLRIFIGKF